MKTYEVTLQYKGACAFTTTERANDRESAIAQAIRYAQANGWPAWPSKKTVRVVA